MSQPTSANPSHDFNARGIQHALEGRWSDAIDAFAQSLKIGPRTCATHINLGHALSEAGRWNEAIDAYQGATRCNPVLPAAFNFLGLALNHQGRSNEAIAAFQNCLRLDPFHEQAVLELGKTLRRANRPLEAVAVFRQAIAAAPQFALAHAALGNTLFSVGQLTEGMNESEWFWDFINAERPQNFAKPKWDGRDPAGLRILCHMDAGFGDALQHVRYVPLLANRGAKVYVGCFSKLATLFQTLPGVEKIITQNQSLPDYDFHCPMHLLPKLFKTTMETIPANTPYLFADPNLSEIWKKKIEQLESTQSTDDLRIGLCWAGSANNGDDINRSITLAHFAVAAQVPNLHFYSLQTGPPADQAKHPPQGMNLTDWSSELTDFAQTAALMNNMDLILTVDTAAAHLAGTLNLPVWVPLPASPDGRWFLERPDSPWYPTMRLFRQPTYGDWTEPFQRMFRMLKDLTAEL
jgi:hypothetical protein